VADGGDTRRNGSTLRSWRTGTCASLPTRWTTRDPGARAIGYGAFTSSARVRT